MRKTLLIIFCLSLFSNLFAQSNYSNTVSYDSLKGSPKASLHEVGWIAGHWRGEAFGGLTEELWSPPLGESMMFVFKLVTNGKVSFYESGSIVEKDGTLLLRLKHFDASFHGWEEKDETVDFKLVKLEKNKAYFDDFTFEKMSDNELNIYVVIGHEGEEEEVKFNYQRVK